MRFDDSFATVMALPGADPASRTAKWRQLVDLLAQGREGERARRDEAYAWLEEHRSKVDPAVRREVARALAGRVIAPDLFAFFAQDTASVVAPLAAGAHLARQDWLHLLPSLTPTARALLRHRRDLDPDVTRALTSFGPSDFVISGTVAAEGAPHANPAAEAGEAQIRDLVARIEAFRQQRGAIPPGELISDATRAESIDDFRWEAGADGVIIWVGNAPRGPLVGQTIASIAERGEFGVDGQAAGAYEKRSPFRDARFRVAGDGPASGDWRISGVPFFDPATGSFLGYRGSARRPRLDEVARAEAVQHGLFGAEFPADSLRQLVHELRTPLNAIVGFAELIDGQYMGPAAANYRSRAAEIMDQASRLLSAVDDLDTAARIETRRLDLDESTTDLVALLCRLHDAYERVASHRDSSIAIEIAHDLPPARVELAAAERMFARMLAATIGLAREGETISATMDLGTTGSARMLCLAIDRPQAIEGLDEAALLDPGYSPEGDWPGAPALGLGFALRLVRNLAEAVGGALHVGVDRFSLYLPTADAAERSTG